MSSFHVCMLVYSEHCVTVWCVAVYVCVCLCSGIRCTLRYSEPCMCVAVCVCVCVLLEAAHCVTLSHVFLCVTL